MQLQVEITYYFQESVVSFTHLTCGNVTIISRSAIVTDIAGKNDLQPNHTKKNLEKNLGFENPQVLVFPIRFTQNKNQGFLENHDLSWFDTKF